MNFNEKKLTEHFIINLLISWKKAKKNSLRFNYAVEITVDTGHNLLSVDQKISFVIIEIGYTH